MRPFLSALVVAMIPAAAQADPPEPVAQGAGHSDAQLDAEHPPLGDAQVKAAERADRRHRKARPAAEGAAAAPAEGEGDDQQLGPRGHYGGVELGGPNLPPRQTQGKGGVSHLTWLGFRVEKGIPTVFVELSRPVVWSLDQRPGTLVYTLQQTSIPLTNNRRPVDATAFGTTVRRVVAERHGRDVQLTIRTSATVAPAHRERNEEAAGGLKFLVIELPQP
jgi:hypothetical protein